MNDNSQQRMCPVCGQQMTAMFCPMDGGQTVFTDGLLRMPWDYGVDHVVGGRYRIVEQIARGGFSTVFRAEHVGTGQTLALKLLALVPGNAAWLTALQRFFREARVTAGLQHPNTVRVFDVGQDADGALYLTMEHLVGESLEQILIKRVREGTALNETEAMEVALGVLDSLAEAHECGLVHRDLKPGNIMMTVERDGTSRVKVLDFGIARTAGSMLTSAGQVPGTPPFMSPELCLGREIDNRSDIYALGAVLYLCITGRAPFQDGHALQIMRAHIDEPPPDPRPLTPHPITESFIRVILTALAKEPAERPATAANMAKMLRALQPRKAEISRRQLTPRHSDSGLSDPKIQAAVLARLSNQAKDPWRKLDYARQAVALDPRDLELRELERMARALLARARRGSRSQQPAAQVAPEETR